MGSPYSYLSEAKGVESFIDVSSVHWYMRHHGWTFQRAGPGVVADPVFDAAYMHEIYTAADLNHSGRVPYPFDKEKSTLVNNESSEIIRMFNSAFDEKGATPGDYWPVERRNREGQ